MNASRNKAIADSDRYLGGVLDRLTAAPARDEALRIAKKAARELGGADDLCLLSEAEARNFSNRDAHTLLVPLPKASGRAAVGFVWQRGLALDPQATLRLELLAKAVGLAARMWHLDEEHATKLRDERRAASELQHRLRNNLALMRSVIRRSTETAESTEDVMLHLDARIGALTRRQGLLAAAGAGGVELDELIRAELVASAAPTRRYRVEGPAVRLRSKAAESLGLALHELATNSLKFGALAVDTGFLAVTWTVAGSPAQELRLSWAESGVKIVSLAPRRRGFGQELIERTLPYELDARTRLAFTPGGVECTMAMPLQACAVEFEVSPAQTARARGNSDG